MKYDRMIRFLADYPPDHVDMVHTRLVFEGMLYIANELAEANRLKRIEIDVLATAADPEQVGPEEYDEFKAAIQEPGK